jgi:hypothetical protein
MCDCMVETAWSLQGCCASKASLVDDEIVCTSYVNLEIGVSFSVVVCPVIASSVVFYQSTLIRFICTNLR